MTRVAAVLWSGALGGAETFTADLCAAMRDQGAEPAIVFLGAADPLSERLDAAGIPYSSLGLRRGSEVVLRPRALADSVVGHGAQGVLLPRGGYLAAALRVGGYRGRVVATVHDAVVEHGMPAGFVRGADRAVGFRAADVEVAVSDFALARQRQRLHAPALVRIYNGVDLERYRPAASDDLDMTASVGSAGRLVDGKGVDVLLEAFARGPAQEGAHLRIAGDGPARHGLEARARSLGIGDAVEFVGWAGDVAAFWRGCAVAAMPSHRFESFGLAAVEAMACGVPVVVTATGALPELVEDGVSGWVVPPGDADALAEALLRLVRDAELRRSAGVAARARCQDRFDIRDCAGAYLDLLAGRARRAAA